MTENGLTHLNEKGEAHMVDISEKNITSRQAVAEGYVYMQHETLRLLKAGQAKKGDVLATARIAGIMAAKRTHDLIPLCHPLALSKITVDFDIEEQAGQNLFGVRVQSSVKVDGKTGVEMEALTAISVACLTIYDMLKAVDKAMYFTNIRLLEKTGGKSGCYTLEKD